LLLTFAGVVGERGDRYLGALFCEAQSDRTPTNNGTITLLLHNGKTQRRQITFSIPTSSFDRPLP